MLFVRKGNSGNATQIYRVGLKARHGTIAEFIIYWSLQDYWPWDQTSEKKRLENMFYNTGVTNGLN